MASHVPDRLGAADVPEEAAREQGVPAAVAALLDDQYAGTGVVGGDGRAGSGRTAPDDQDVNVHALSLPSRVAQVAACAIERKGRCRAVRRDVHFWM